MYPDLVNDCKITVYDVAPKVLPMFDETLSKYAMRMFRREGIQIKTSHHVERLRRGVPSTDKQTFHDEQNILTLQVRQEGEIGLGMVVWSTGLMKNPFIERALAKSQPLPSGGAKCGNGDNGSERGDWTVKLDPKTGGLLTDSKLRVIMEPVGASDGARAVLEVSDM